MPVYLCQSGSGTEDSWRHGLRVFAEPCVLDPDSILHSNNSNSTRPSGDLMIADWKDHTAASSNNNTETTTATANNNTEQQPQPQIVNNHHHVRRLRHSEIVIADDICVAHERYWLRLRWPGSKGGFAGYVAMGLVSEVKANSANAKDTMSMIQQDISGNSVLRISESLEEERGGAEETDVDDPIREEEPPDAPFEHQGVVKCLRTGLDFHTSPNLKFLTVYDDGLNPSVSLAPFQMEPVFCRICREGLHDDADDEQPAPEGAETSGVGGAAVPDDDDDEPPVSDPLSTDNTVSQGPVSPALKFQTNQNAQDNPLLSPCECSGSMAFVHYLCVEQWRCRSRHPDAHNGLNCETCGTSYALPPPTERVAAQAEQEDWVEAMPPHVMQALRQPHFCWQLGMAVVRRRYLRPLAPILVSPIVALYCRARRLLKKRGVARRRWACSLCRRRARWKCVRCLRSYYCSRPCQNVSWHIVHKHVCYKPARLWSSVVVYGAACLALFPGILRDPFMYDIGLFVFPMVSFYVLAVLGGGVASCFKTFMGVDMRGRAMEAAVVFSTLWLTAVSWKLVQGFFGDSEACFGVIGSYTLSKEDLSSTYMLRGLHKLLLRPAEVTYLWTDQLFNNFSWFRSALCSAEWSSETSIGTAGCFERLPHSNADFFLQEHGGSKCAADILLVGWLYVTAGFAFVGSHYLKQHERERRRLGRRAAPRPHQD